LACRRCEEHRNQGQNQKFAHHFLLLLPRSPEAHRVADFRIRYAVADFKLNQPGSLAQSSVLFFFETF
jgi:hypothetical protein